MSNNPVYDFCWKGQSAFSDFGIVTLSVGSTVIAERRDDPQTVPGRSGLVHDQDGAVEEIDRQVTIYLPYEQGGTVAALSAVRAWLKGYGALTLSTIPNRYMMAWITDQVALEPVVEGFAELKGGVIFRCDPYLYHTSVQPITLTAAGNVNNPGTAPAAPVITVDAVGDIDLMIGMQTILLTGLIGPIIVNSLVQEAYATENGQLVNLNNRMAGDFPTLPPGITAVSWAVGENSSLTGITIEPYWRDEN